MAGKTIHKFLKQNQAAEGGSFTACGLHVSRGETARLPGNITCIRCVPEIAERKASTGWYNYRREYNV